MTYHLTPTRVEGRAALHEALNEIDAAAPQWQRLHELLEEARKLGNALTAAGVTASIHVGTAAEAHFDGDHALASSVSSLLGPTIVGADADTTRAIAYQLKEVIDALPCGFRITSEWMSLNPVAYANSGQCPGLAEVRARAASDVGQTLGALCAGEVAHV